MANKKTSASSKIEGITEQIEEIEIYYEKQKNLVTKAFTRKSWKRSLILFLFISMIFYLAAFAAAFADFDGMAFKGWNNEISEYFFDFSKDGWGVNNHWMPFYLFVHFCMLAVIGKSMQDAVLVTPRVMKVDMDDLKKSIKRVRSNIGGFLIALPFIIYDAVRSYNEVSESDKVIINPLVHWIVTLSWIVEWFIFGAIIWSLVAYVFFVRKITSKYSYEENILKVIVRGELEPLIRLGFRLTIALGVFLVVNIAYIFVEGNPWPSDFIGIILTLLILPILTIVPLQLIERDVSHEQGLIADRFLTKYVQDGIGFIRDPKAIDLESKVDILLGRRLLETFQEYRRETVKVYLRMGFTMAISLGGLVWNYSEEIADFVKDYDLSQFVSVALNFIIWFL
ncbi:MAG: hypothetical protein ACFFB3_11050 [Candidatus Hodarchaeota archaeon]